MADVARRPEGAMKVDATLVVSGPAVVTTGLLACDDGEFHTVKVASPGGAARVVLAGSVHELGRVLRAALDALPPEARR